MKTFGEILEIVMTAPPERLTDPDFGIREGANAIFKEAQDTGQHAKVMAALQIRQAVEQIGSARRANSLLWSYTVLTAVIAVSTVANVILVLTH